ncbi:hypothetical protein [Mucilaginibacter sp.]|uniref:hypothetical protein n=1 Tax=Mucilaginibacter sp. TaxID=1882438 RepID=UPI0025F6F1A0|nr:hypothetical protein [Mucilaginibacter sp.]
MTAFNGIQVYEILENGNLLNGIYTNTKLQLKNGIDYHIDIEIARKQHTDNEGVKGDYNCRYIESNNALVTDCKLKILKHNGVYEFTWSDENGAFWKGLGLMAGTTHIAVSYDGV